MSETQAEIAVLGACLLDASCIGQVADFLVPRDFYAEAHREIYTSMLEMFKLGHKVDDISVCTSLREREKYEIVGGASYVSTLTDVLPDVTNIDFYATKVKNQSAIRALKWLGKTLENAEGNPQEVVADAVNKLTDISSSSLRSVPKKIGDVMSSVVDSAISVARGKTKRNVILTGYNKLDAVLGGLSPSDLLIIAARPSVGKSALALVLSKMVAEQGHPVLFISLEMSEEQIATRLAAEETGLHYTWIQDGNLSDVMINQLEDNRRRYSTIPLIIDDKGGQSVSDIRTKAIRQQAQGGLGLVVVDYLQIAAKDPSDFGQVSVVSTQLKNLAKDLKVPVLALAQLNRNIEHRDGNEPMLSDLRQSGQVEQDADLISFLMRDGRDRETGLERRRLLVKKHRNGPLGTINFTFDPNVQRFFETGGTVG